MKTTVLGYSKNGVYVEVENSFASLVFDFNTTDNSCVEVDRFNCKDLFDSEIDYISYQDSYTLSNNEKEVLTEAFNSLFN